jgi:hypothetical protein
LTETSFLFESDRITNEVIGKIISSQHLCFPGDLIPVEGSKEKLIFPQQFSMQALRKIRSNFMKICEMNPPELKDIATLFVIYLNSNLN